MTSTLKFPSLNEAQTGNNQNFLFQLELITDQLWGSGVKHTNSLANQTVNILQLLPNILNDTSLKSLQGIVPQPLINVINRTELLDLTVGYYDSTPERAIIN